MTREEAMPAAIGVAGDVLHALRDGAGGELYVYDVPIITAPELAPGSVVAMLSNPQRIHWSAQ